MIVVKKRKSRTTGSDLNFDGAHMFGVPSSDTITSRKLSDRLSDKLCLGCGEKKCRCKSKRI